MNSESRAILTTIAYFDQFGRALTKTELIQLIWGIRVFTEAVERSLHNLIKQGILQHDGLYYGLSSNIVKTTVHRQKLITMRRDTALHIAQILSKIRGIKSVVLMNSLAMQTCHEGSDIDLLVIANSDSLYLSRTLSLLNLKARGLAKSRLHKAGRACLGYWLTESNLGVWQHQTNTYTAAYWLATMVPLFGIHEYHRFIEANSWINQYLPNWKAHKVAHLPGDHQTKVGAVSARFNRVLFPLHRARILADHEFVHSAEAIVNIDRLKLHSIDHRPNYSTKMQSILDILLAND